MHMCLRQQRCRWRLSEPRVRHGTPCAQKAPRHAAAAAEPMPPFLSLLLFAKQLRQPYYAVDATPPAVSRDIEMILLQACLYADDAAFLLSFIASRHALPRDSIEVDMRCGCRHDANTDSGR